MCKTRPVFLQEHFARFETRQQQFLHDFLLREHVCLGWAAGDLFAARDELTLI